MDRDASQVEMVVIEPLRLLRQTNRGEELIIDFEDGGVDYGDHQTLDDADAEEGGADDEHRGDQEGLGYPVRPIRVVLPEQPVSDHRVDENRAERGQEPELGGAADREAIAVADPMSHR